MSWFDKFLARKSSRPYISVGSRGEDLTYSLGDKVAYFQYTCLDGGRLYSDSIDGWYRGASFTREERSKIFKDLLDFINDRTLIVVINNDDPHAEEWRRLCGVYQSQVAEIETTSDKEQQAQERQMYLSVLSAGKALAINDVEIKSEADLDKYLLSQRRDLNGREHR